MSAMRIQLVILGILGAQFGAKADPPVNDECQNALPIAGLSVSFDSTDATDSPIEHAACAFRDGAAIEKDLWYIWTADQDGEVSVETCAHTTLDTKLAVYAGSSCPPLESDLIGCNDDACAYQSRVTYDATDGESYLLRVGSHPGILGGSGSIQIHRDDVLPSLFCQSYCVRPDYWDAFQSTRGKYVAVHSLVRLNAGIANTVCWYGTYGPDSGPSFDAPEDFEITYHVDENGLPGAVLAGPFSQSAQTLTMVQSGRTSSLIADTAPEHQYAAIHPDVPLNGGNQYWVSITNSVDWYWARSYVSGRSLHFEDSGEGPFLDDVRGTTMAVCVLGSGRYDLSPLGSPVVNDTCLNAAEAPLGYTIFDLASALTESPATSCDFVTHDSIYRDVWFNHDAVCTGRLSISTCQSELETRLVVYPDGCLVEGSAALCGDDDCGVELALQSEVSLALEEGEALSIRVGSYWPYRTGVGTLELKYVTPLAPNLWDQAGLANCFTGSCLSPPCKPIALGPCCDVWDLDSNGRVDLADYSNWVLLLSDP